MFKQMNMIENFWSRLNKKDIIKIFHCLERSLTFIMNFVKELFGIETFSGARCASLLSHLLRVFQARNNTLRESVDARLRLDIV